MKTSHSDYKQLAEQYELRAEAFELFYQDRLKPCKAFIVLAGVIAQMNIDLISYERKHGKSEKIKPLQERVDILTSIYEEFSGMDEKIVRLKELLRSNHKRFAELEAKNKELQSEVEKLTRSLNGL